MKLEENCCPTNLFQIETGVFSQGDVSGNSLQTQHFNDWASLNTDILGKVSEWGIGSI